jgi:hypothetical protein
VVNRLSVIASGGTLAAPDSIRLWLYAAPEGEYLLLPESSTAAAGGVELPWPPRLP